MPRKDNQKKKLLALREVMLHYTDEAHGLTIPEIQEHLKDYDIEADRRTLYEDLLLLEEFGLEVCNERYG